MLDISISMLAIRQHEEEVEFAFALSTDDGENLIDDDDGIMETYDGNAT